MSFKLHLILHLNRRFSCKLDVILRTFHTSVKRRKITFNLKKKITIFSEKRFLSYDVGSGSEIRPCYKINIPDFRELL